jgi:hypothetical protein
MIWLRSFSFGFAQLAFINGNFNQHRFELKPVAHDIVQTNQADANMIFVNHGQH